jgi:hypothetical protein
MICWFKKKKENKGTKFFVTPFRKMAKRSTRRMRKEKGKKFFSKVYAPLHHVLQATRNVSRGLFSASSAVVDKGLQVVDNTGSAIARHANMAVKNVTSRKSSRKNSRKVTRKNRK